VTRLGDQAGVNQPVDCHVVRNADHSVTVRCPVGQSVTLMWNFKSVVTAASVNCLSWGGCKNQPTITQWHHHTDLGLRSGYAVSIIVHSNTVASMTATVG
jgi:hypothetical protein